MSITFCEGRASAVPLAQTILDLWQAAPAGIFEAIV